VNVLPPPGVLRRTLVTAICFALALGACSGTGATTAPSAAPSSAAPSSAAPSAAPSSAAPSSAALAGTLNVMLWDNGASSITAYNVLGAAFKKANPDITVNIETSNSTDYDAVIKTRLAGGAGPDVYGVRPQLIPDLVTGGYLEPLSDQPWFNTLNKSAQNAPNAVQDGKAYAVPIIQAGDGMIYNLALFKKAGITKVPTTFKELVDVCKQLSAAGITPIAMAAGDSGWPQFLLYHLTAQNVAADSNDKIMTGKATFSDDKGWQTTLDYYQQLIPYFMPNPVGATEEAAKAGFLQGTVAMFPSVFFIPKARDAGLEVGYFGFPGSDTADSQRIWGGYPVQIGINPKNGRTKLAEAFLDFLYSSDFYPGFVSMLSSYPVIDGTKITESDPLSPTLQADWKGKTLVASPADTWLPGVQDAMLASVQELTAGRISTADVLAAMDKATANALKK